MPTLKERAETYGSRQLINVPGSQLQPALRESDLFAIWERHRFPKGALTSREGGEVRAVYRGRVGLGPGPDFRDAIVSLPDRLAAGDVELHVRASDFRRHGHHLDPAYNGVVLHLVFVDDLGVDTELEDGTLVPVVALGKWIEGRAREMRRWLGRGTGWQEPCRTSVERMGVGEVTATLERLGAMRFRQKAAALGKRLKAGETPEEALWSGILEALGYGGERETLVRLARAVPWRALRERVLGAAEGDEALEARRLLADGWLLLQPNALWRAGLRPGNRPERRVEGAAALAARFAGDGLAASLLAPLDESPMPLEDVLAALTVPKLIGRARAIEIAGNVVLPLAAALCGLAGSLRYRELFAGLPLSASYGAVRHVREAVEVAVPVNMARQQGMLYLLRQYCTQGGCGRCPLS